MRVDFDITPMGAPRMNRADAWKGRAVVLRYRLFRDTLRLQARNLGFALPDSFVATFYLPMPPSWSEKKKQLMDGKPHQQKPDASNLLKALEDALRTDDERIWDPHPRKFWARKGRIVIDTA